MGEEEDYWERFVQNVGLITTRSNGKDNIMCAAWTYQISYEPGLIEVCIGPGKISGKNIEKSKEFGVHLAHSSQNVVSSVAGSSDGNKVDKIKVLKELGVKFFEAEKIKTLLMKDCALCVECKLKKKIEFGDHIMYVGEVVKVHEPSNKDVLLYHSGKYFRLGDKVSKPEPAELERIKKIVEKYTNA